MVPRLTTLAAVLLLLASMAVSAPGRGPVAAQEGEPTATYAWPEIGTFQVPGEIQTPGTIEAAGTVASVPGAISVAGAAGGRQTLSTDVGVDLILDNSGSMLIDLEGQRRIDIAKQVMSDLVQHTLPQGIPMALRVFGDTPDSCDTSLAIDLQPLDRQSALSEIASIESVDGVKTPIGAALEAVASDLQGVEGPKIVVLVTDGEETCGGNPKRAIRDLVAKGIDVKVNIVGFAVEDEQLKKEFEEWARLGGGQFFDASNASELGDAIAAALRPPFEVRNANGEVVGTGLVGGPPVRVDPGTYTVTVHSEPPQTFDNVAVGNGQEVALTLQ
jgi:hypothetical protein